MQTLAFEPRTFQLGIKRNSNGSYNDPTRWTQTRKTSLQCLTCWVSDLLTCWVSDLLTCWVSDLLTYRVSDLLTYWVSDLLTYWVSDALLLFLQATPADRPTVLTDVTVFRVPAVLPGYRGSPAPPATPAPTDTASPRSASWPWWRPCRPRTPG